MSRKKRDDDKVNNTLENTAKADRKMKIQGIYAKAVKANGKALERLSKK